MKVNLKTSAILTIFLVMLFTTSNAQAGDWPMFQHDAAHTGATEESVQPPLELVWQSDTVGTSHSSPSVVGDMLFTTDSYGGGVYAVDAKTGITKWNYAPEHRILHSSPIVSENIVFIGTDGYLYAINATNGYFNWKYEHKCGSTDTATVVGGNVYFSVGMVLFSVDAATGKERWKYEANVRRQLHVIYEISPAVVDDVVYLGKDNLILAVNADTGKEKWNHTIDEVVRSTLTVVDGIVYVGGDNNLHAFYASNGNEKWKYQVGGAIESSPAVSRGIVYFGSVDHFVYALDAATGKEIWRFKTDGPIRSSPVVSRNILYICSDVLEQGSQYASKGAIYAFDTSEGTLKCKQQVVGFRIDSTPAIANDMLYIMGFSGIRAFAHSDTAPAFEEITAISSQSDTSPTEPIHDETEPRESILTPYQTLQSSKSSMSLILLLAATVVVVPIFFVVSKRKASKEVASEPTVPKTDGSIDIKRGYEILPSNDIKFGIRVTNNTGYSIMNAESILEYPENLFSTKDNVVYNLGNIDNGGTRTATYILKPMNCIHQEKISALITYRDPLGKKQTVRMRPKEVHCVWPFLNGIDMTTDEYIRFAENGYHQEDGISFDGVSIEDMIKIVHTTCAQKLKQIDEATTANGGKIVYFAAESLGEKAKYLLTVLVREYRGLTQIILRAHSDNKYGLVGFLNEIIDSVRHLTVSITSAKEIGVIERTQIINIIDSVVQRTSFGGIGDADVNSKDSVVMRSKFGENDNE